MTTYKKNNFFENCSFVKGVANIEGLEISDVPEIAFLGRSNVGKSTLLNAITKRSKLAHTSKTPGRTQELNFFAQSIVQCIKAYITLAIVAWFNNPFFVRNPFIRSQQQPKGFKDF